jgi:DNA-binding NarL/FixJ family response regulator
MGNRSRRCNRRKSNTANGLAERLNGETNLTGDGPSPLTQRQQQVLQLMTRYGEQFDEAPSVSFIARRLQVHRTTVQDHLEAIHRKGWLPAPRPWLSRRR